MPEIIVPSATTPRDPLGAGGLPPAGEGTPVVINVQPVQVAGLTPLYDCAATECRSLPEDCCERLIVFGGSGIEIESNGAPDYENDWSSFLIDVALYSPNPLAVTVSVSLEKCSGNQVWSVVATLTSSNTYGRYIGLNTLPGHPTYFGYRLSWPRVLALHGAGVYRIKFNTAMRTLAGCLVSAEFYVRKFNCNIAHGTVKFETILSGKIGSSTVQGLVYDLCGITTSIANVFKGTGWYDSLRVKGFFGFEKIKEYFEVKLEYANGKQELIKDEAIQAYTFKSNYFSKDLHDRLKVYMMMADERWISDYNINNSDYNINRLKITKAGNYEPVYLDQNHHRKSKVEVQFESSIQGIIKSLCCPRG